MSRKFAFFVLCCCLVFVIYGCRAVSKSIDYYKACKGDEVCIQDMERVRVGVSSSVSSGMKSVSSVNSWCEIVGAVAGSVASLFAGIYYGRRKVRKNG